MSVFVDGLLLGGMSFAAGYAVYNRLPPRAQKFFQEHKLVTEFTTTGMVYVLLGGGVTALFGAAFTSLLVTCALYIADHPDDFAWVRDILDRAKEMLNKTIKIMKEYNDSYMAAKKRARAALAA